MDMEEKIDQLHHMIREIYPKAVSVKVFVNCEGIEVTPEYRTNLDGYSMKTINGEWIIKEEK